MHTVKHAFCEEQLDLKIIASLVTKDILNTLNVNCKKFLKALLLLKMG